MKALRNFKTISSLLAGALLVAAFALPAQAFAGQSNCSDAGSDPTAAQYCSIEPANEGGGNNPSNNENQPTNSGGENTPAPAETSVATVEDTSTSGSSGSLPFTGLDVGILFVVAAILVGTGLLLRRLTAVGAKQG